MLKLSEISGTYKPLRDFKNATLGVEDNVKKIYLSKTGNYATKIAEGQTILRQGSINGNDYLSIVSKNGNSRTFVVQDSFIEKIIPANSTSLKRGKKIDAEKNWLCLSGHMEKDEIVELFDCKMNGKKLDKFEKRTTPLNSKDLENLLTLAEGKKMKIHNLTKLYIKKVAEFLKTKNA